MSEMKVDVEELSPILRRVSVEVPAARVDAALDRAYRAVGKRARIRGFRPGKVPRRILEQHYGRQLAHDVAEDLVRETFFEAAEQQGVRPVGPPRVEDHLHVHPGKAFSYSAKVEVLPEVKVSAYQGFELRAPRVEVKQEEIDATLEDLAERMAQLVPVEDRDVVEEGDYVVCDVAATLDGAPFEAGSGEGMTLRAEPGEITGGAVPEAIGKKKRESFEVESTLPEDHPNEEAAGKTLHFTVTIREIKRKEVPPIDDELAQDLGEEGIDSLLALRGDIREKLKKRREEERRSVLREAIVDQLIEKNPIEVPPAMVQRGVEALLRPMLMQLAMQGLDPSQLPRETFESLARESRPRAERMVKASLLLEAVAKAEGIEVSDEALKAHLAERAEREGVPVEKLEAKLKREDEKLEGLRRQLLEDRVFDFILEHSEITEVDPEEFAEGRKAGETSETGEGGDASAEPPPAQPEDGGATTADAEAAEGNKG